MSLTISYQNEKKRIFVEDEECVVLSFSSGCNLELWESSSDNVISFSTDYTDIMSSGKSLLCSATISYNKIRIIVLDTFSIMEETLVLERKVRVEKGADGYGMRIRTKASFLPDSCLHFQNCKFFAPPELFDKNDIDGDGFEDFFKTQCLLYREDRLNYPQFQVYDPDSRRSVIMRRIPFPSFDSIPERKAGSSHFMQKTDVGSIGVWSDDGGVFDIEGCYPFYEGNATIGLYILKTVPFGAFWPLENGTEMVLSYSYIFSRHSNFHEALWWSIRSALHANGEIKAKALIESPDEIFRYRLEALNRYYVEKSHEEDDNEPAGYVMNCHPQDGVQLENIIQYGFTGQNLLNAYSVLRYGYENGIPEYIRRGRRIADFFVNVIHIPESGMFYNLYNTDRKKVDFWWTGLLLPLAYAEGEELEKLMGPLYEYRKPVIEALAEVKGAYLRCMNEDVTALLKLFLYEKDHGIEHEAWRKAILSYAEFLLKAQRSDGSYYRAYALDGSPLTEPAFWFGPTQYEQSSSAGTCISLLIDIYHLTGEERFLEAAILTGRWVYENIIVDMKFNGGVHDSIYSKGELIDNESILYPMFGMLSLYEETKNKMFLDGAIKAARLFASWICLWDVPLPEDSTLRRYGLSSIGLGACDTCGAGYTHPFQLMGVAELSHIAVLAEDEDLFNISKLYWLGCNETVSLPECDWGYAYYGLQEEGYLLSWYAVDDPMFSGDTGFGNRLKGEGNKTCFAWIPAVAGKAYWALKDLYGTSDFATVDFSEAKKLIASRFASET